MTSSLNHKSHLADRIRAAAAEHGLFGQESSIVLAVSGGADSVCMTHILHHLACEMCLKLYVAHFNHRLRGDEAERDARFVERLAASLHLPFVCGSGDVRALADNRKVSVQEAARILRYEFLEDVRKKNGAQLIATAHNADDQAEEVLSRLIRGSSLRGLSGIPWKRDRVIRPILGLYSQEIREFLNVSMLEYVEDSSNKSLKYLRNRIRLDLLPYIRENYNPAITDTLNRVAALLSEDMNLLEQQAAAAYDECLVPGQGGPDIRLDTEKLLGYHPAIRRRIYRLAIEHIDCFDGRMASVHLNAVDRLVLSANPSAWLDLPGRLVARRDYNLLHFHRYRDERRAGYDFEIDSPGHYVLPGGAGEIILSEQEAPAVFDRETGCFPRLVYLHPQNIRFPLRIRNRLPGDRFEPVGRGFECRLKKFLINCRVPKPVRSMIPLVFMKERLVAVAGLEVSDTAALPQGYSGRCLVLEWSCPGLR